MAGHPDLDVVCRNCGSHVSPYITECPYCGQRLRKRAPKIDRDESGESRPRPARRVPRPTLGPLRSGEIPGIRGDHAGRPYATITLVLLSVVGLIVLAFVDSALISVSGAIDGEWWRVASSPFLYGSRWYEFAAVGAIALFGWLLERRHGPLLVLVLFAAGGIGGIAATAALQADPLALGGNGAALALFAAWAVPVLLGRRRPGYDDDDVDLLGACVIAALVLSMSLALDQASPIAAGVGLLAGAVSGLGLARVSPRR